MCEPGSNAPPFKWLERRQALRLVDLEPTVLAAPAIERGLGYAMARAQLADHAACSGPSRIVTICSAVNRAGFITPPRLAAEQDSQPTGGAAHGAGTTRAALAGSDAKVRRPDRATRPSLR